MPKRILQSRGNRVAHTAELDKNNSWTGDNSFVSAVQSAASFISTAVTGAQPYQCVSTTKNDNLNADMLDGNHSTAFQQASANLTSIAGLSYASGSFVKMTGAGTFTLDTNTYYKSGDSPSFATVTGSYFQTSTAPTANSSGTVVIVAKDAGALTANAGWMPFKKSDGTTVYIPYWA